MNALRAIGAGVWNRILEEPVYTQGLVVAVIATGTAFGLGWNGLQVGAVSALSAAFLSWLTRRLVTPVTKPELPQGTTVTVVTPEGEPNRIETV